MNNRHMGKIHFTPSTQGNHTHNKFRDPSILPFFIRRGAVTGTAPPSFLRSRFLFLSLSPSLSSKQHPRIFTWLEVPVEVTWEVFSFAHPFNHHHNHLSQLVNLASTNLYICETITFIPCRFITPPNVRPIWRHTPTLANALDSDRVVSSTCIMEQYQHQRRFNLGENVCTSILANHIDGGGWCNPLYTTPPSVFLDPEATNGHWDICGPGLDETLPELIWTQLDLCY